MSGVLREPLRVPHDALAVPAGPGGRARLRLAGLGLRQGMGSSVEFPEFEFSQI